MSDLSDARHGAAWQLLYERILKALRPYGDDDAFGDKEYWVSDQIWSTKQQKVNFNVFPLLHPSVVEALRRTLTQGFEDWEIVVCIDPTPTPTGYPERTGFLIRAHEIVDGINRDWLPEEWREVTYPNMRAKRDSDWAIR
jgi:hypothetical protein